MNGFRAWAVDVIRGIVNDLRRAHRSMTIWFNVVFLPIMAVYWPQIWDAIPQLAGMMPESKYNMLLAIGTVVNVVLRFRTSKALRHK